MLQEKINNSLQTKLTLEAEIESLQNENDILNEEINQKNFQIEGI